MNLTGRDFLTLKDFTPEEILYLIDLSAKLKDMKKKGIVEQPLRGKNVALIFEKTSTRPTLTRRVPRLARKKALQIRQECFVQCLKALSTEDLSRRLWKNWQNIHLYRYGTV